MNVSLTPELERLVQEKVASGLYNSASEVVREALRILKERDEMRSLALEDLKREIAAGLDDLDRGEAEVLDIEAIKAEGRRRLAV